MIRISRSQIICSVLLLFSAQLYGQAPKEVTTDLTKKINSEIDQAAKTLKLKFEKDKNLSKDWIEFSLDTFRINEYERKYLKYDYSTAGMSNIAHESADKYDKLLNKYYKKLLTKLEKEDKESLVQAQRAWITFRDKEMQLESTLEQEKYSGGGTIQIVRHASVYQELIIKRTIEIFEYCESAGTF